MNRCLKKEIATKNYEDSLLKARPTGGGDEADDEGEEKDHSGAVATRKGTVLPPCNALTDR